MSNKPKKQLAQKQTFDVPRFKNQLTHLFKLHKNCSTTEEQLQSDEWKTKRSDARKMIYPFVEDSKGKIDAYGLPIQMSLVDIYSSMKENAISLKENRDSVIAELKDVDSKSMDSICKEYPILADTSIDEMYFFTTDDDIEKDMLRVSKFYGEFVQIVLRPMKKLVNTSILPTSKKFGKPYPTEQTQKVMDDLELLWKDNLPIKFTTKLSYFKHLAVKYCMSWESIKKIESKYRPNWNQWTPTSYKSR